jgi:hypothetical protein
MSNDFDFEESRPSHQKIDYKAVFFNPKEGTNLIRIADLKGKSFKVHYLKDINDKYVFVKSPGAGDPLIVQGNQPRTRYYIKIIEREANKLKIWEFGSQIKQQIEEFVNDLKEKRKKGSTDEEDILTNYNIEIRKRKPGSNPLYMLNVRDRITDQKLLTADAAMITAEDIDFEPLLKPWSIERIKQQILGIGEGDGKTGNGGVGATASANVTATSTTAEASPAPAPSVSAPATKASPQAVMAKAAKADDSWLDED